MKLITFCLIVSVFTCSQELVGQDRINNNIFNNVEIGSYKYYSVFTNDGSNYHARIISADDKVTLISTPKDNSFFIPTSEISRIIKKPFYSFGSIGFGIGLAYSGLGTNLDIHIFKGLYITGSIGTLFSAEPFMYNIGGKYILRPGGHRWLPRVSVYYGKNRVLNYDYIKESFQGLTIGIGQQWALAIRKAWAFDFDIHYVFNQDMQNRIDELIDIGYPIDSEWSRFDFSIGLRYCF